MAAAAIPMILQGLSTIVPATAPLASLAAAHPIALSAGLGALQGASHGGGLEGALKNGAIAGLSQFAGGALGKALGGAGNAATSAATQPVTDAASAAAPVASGVGSSVGAASSLQGLQNPVLPQAGDFTGGGSSPIGQGLAATNTTQNLAVTAPNLGSRITSGAGAGLPSPTVPTLGERSQSQTSTQTEPEKNNSNSNSDAMKEVGQQLVNRGLSALTAPKGISGGPSSVGGVVRPAAGGGLGAGFGGGTANAGALRPNIYPWAGAASS